MMNKVDVMPLAERMRKVENGWARDPAPYVERLERTKAASLYEVCPDGTHVFKDGNTVSLPALYQDAARMVAEEWRALVENGDPDELFSVDPIADEVYDVFIFLWLLAGEEANRRWNREKSNFMDCENLSDVFPALAMPLPELFQAAYASTEDPARKAYFKSAYGRFQNFLDLDPRIRERADTQRKQQPLRWDAYCDVAAMASVLMYALQSKILYIDPLAELAYDLLVLPFVEEAPIPRGMPISSWD